MVFALLYLYTYPHALLTPTGNFRRLGRWYPCWDDACLYRHEGYIGKREKKISWGCYPGFPAGGATISADDSLRIIDTGRIYHASNAQMAAQISQQRQQFQQIKAG